MVPGSLSIQIKKDTLTETIVVHFAYWVFVCLQGPIMTAIWECFKNKYDIIESSWLNTSIIH